MPAPAYTTSDLHIAAYLLCEGANFLGCERLRPKKMAFHFVADEGLHVLLRLYWRGQPLPIVPSKLLAALHQLKCLSIRRP
jgi:Domain of unknown function (DUF5659)